MPIIEFVNTKVRSYPSVEAAFEKWKECYLMFFFEKRWVKLWPYHTDKVKGCAPLYNVFVQGNNLMADDLVVGYFDAKFDAVYLVNAVDDEKYLVWQAAPGGYMETNASTLVTFSWENGHVMQFTIHDES